MVVFGINDPRAVRSPA